MNNTANKQTYFTQPKAPSFFREYMRLILPLFLLSIIIITAITIERRQVKLDALTIRAEDIVKEQQSVFETQFANTVSDAQILAQAVNNRIGEDGLISPEAKQELTRYFQIFSQYRGMYDQVRYLDFTGLEIIRINKGQEQMETVPEEELQNKSSRSYFKKGMAMETSVYISAFDLNVENGEIERPIKPMIRVVAPVTGKNGVRAGLVILNYEGRQLLDRLKSQTQNFPGLIALVNSAGYWLLGPERENEWGFMFPERAACTMSRDYPECWEVIDSTLNGQVLTTEGLVTFHTMHSEDTFDDFLKVSIDREETWKVVSIIPPSQLIPAEEPILFLTGFILFCLLAVGAAILTQSQVRRKAAVFALQQSEETIRTVYNSVQDAIINIDSQGRIKVWNRAATRMFGYTAEEVFGKNVHLLLARKQDQEDALKAMEKFQHTGKGPIVDTLREVTAVKKDGTTFPVELAVSAVNPNGEWQGIGSVRDISKRKKTEQQLRESEQRFRAIFNQTFQFIGLLDRDGILLEANQTALAFAGISHDDVVGKPFWEARWWDVSPETQQQLRKSISKAVNGEFIRYEVEVRGAGDSTAIIDFSLRPIQDDEGNVILLIPEGRDITETVRQREELEISRRQFARSFDNAPIGMALVSPEGKFLRVNTELVDILGYSKSELLGRLFEKITHPEDIEIDLEEMQKTLSGELDKYNLEKRYVRKNGEVVWAYLSISLVRDTHAVPLFFVAQIQDISERKRFLEEIRVREEQLRLFVKYTPAAVAMFDNEMRYIIASKAWSRDYGIQEKEIIGRIHYDVFPEIKEMAEWKAIHQRCLKGEVIKREEDRFERQDGSADWLHWEIHPWWTANDEIGGIIMFSEVITERKEAERKIRELNEQLEQRVQERTAELEAANESLIAAYDAAEAASRAKSIFLANMSHEIRTPMNAIIGFSQLMQRDTDITAAQRENLNIIVRACEHLLSLINDVLEMSKIEAGRTQVNISTFDLHELLKELDYMFRIRTDEKQIHWEIFMDSNLPHLVSTDEGKLRQILLNLLSNAVKFTQQGGIILRASLETVVEDNFLLRFSVEDTGSGIDAKDAEKIFEPFHQSDSGVASKEGTGLGLAISREFIRLLGGELELDSTLGKGSIFHFAIMAEPGNEEAFNAPLESVSIIGLAPGQGPCRVLIVDDKETNRILLCKLLHAIGFKTVEACNGEEAVHIFKEQEIQLILMDMIMPVMDGFEAIKHIRALPERGADVIIIAVTASVFENTMEDLQSIGADDVIRKPFKESELLIKIALHLDVKFIFEQQSTPASLMLQQTKKEKFESLSSEGISLNLLEELLSATLSADIDRIGQLIALVKECNQEAADALSIFANDYDYDQLIEVLKKWKGEKRNE